MSPPEQPEDSSGKASEQQPASSLRDLTRQLARGSSDAVSGATADIEPDPDNGQSVFSNRSGIQDPLVKSLCVEEGELSSSSGEETEAAYCPLTERPAKRGKKARKKEKSKHATKPIPKPEEQAVKSRRQLDRARRRQENYLQKRRKEKKLKVFYGRIRSILKLCCAFLWAFLLWEMFQSPLWVLNAPRYQVSHQQLLQPTQLAPLVQPWVGKPLYTIHTGKLAEQIEKRFPVVDRAVVRRSLFPARLNIQVFEKQPWAALYVPAIYDKANAPSKGLSEAVASASEKSETTGQSSVAWFQKPYGMVSDDELIGLAGYTLKPGLFNQAEKILVPPNTHFKVSYWRQLREVAWQARQIKGLHLEAVDIRNPEQVILRYREIPVILGRLNSTASQRLGRLVPLLPKMFEYRDVIESVDLKWEEQVTFHKRPNAHLKTDKNPLIQG